MPLPLIGGAVAGLSTVIARYLVPYIIIKVMFAFGITAFSIIGTTWLVGYIETEMNNNLGNIGASVGSVLLMAGLGEALAIIISCWTAAIQIRILKGTFRGFKVA